MGLKIPPPFIAEGVNTFVISALGSVVTLFWGHVFPGDLFIPLKDMPGKQLVHNHDQLLMKAEKNRSGCRYFRIDVAGFVIGLGVTIPLWQKFH